MAEVLVHSRDADALSPANVAHGWVSPLLHDGDHGFVILMEREPGLGLVDRMLQHDPSLRRF